MVNEIIIAEIKEQIVRDQAVLEALETGQMHLGASTELQGLGDDTEAQIELLKRHIADFKTELDGYGAGLPPWPRLLEMHA